MKILLTIILCLANLYAFSLQKPKVYDEKTHKISGWYMSEKLDGIRAYWDGEELLSKNGNKIYAPKWFIKDFPKFKLDGELWTKRDDFENIQSIVLDKTPSKNWNKITYNIFEVPDEKGNFDKRLRKIKSWLKNNPSKYIKVIPQIKCKDKKHLENFLEELVNKKAEGIILKNPKKEYFIGRNKNILKVKKFYDTEAKVIGINYKNKKFKSLKLKLQNGVVFNLGNGFSKQQRKHPPKLGDIVTFKYYDLTKNGKPKFASFLRVREKE